jgi:hypothetical protein
MVRNNPISWRDPFGLKSRYVTPIPKSFYPNPNVNDPNKATIQCKGDKYEVVLSWAKGKPYESCVTAHENQHIKDWKDRYGEDSCKGVPDGSLPNGRPGLDDFLDDSECKAHAIPRDCANDLAIKCPKSQVPDIKNYAKSENEYLKDHKCPQYKP